MPDDLLPILMIHRYVPKPGQGRPLRVALEAYSARWVAFGYAPLELCRGLQGPHNAVTALQRWSSIVQWHEGRAKAVADEEMRHIVFERIYPVLEASFTSETFEILPPL